jgi:Adenylate and Guanylate cyclase catalytic domain
VCVPDAKKKHYFFSASSDVAVTGLPDERPDHAVVMTKFTRDCLVAFQKLVQSDDVIDRLGVDTRDLALRIGIHSGEVVAGVLRGEKSRYVREWQGVLSAGLRYWSAIIINTTHLLCLGTGSRFLAIRSTRRRGARVWANPIAFMFRRRRPRSSKPAAKGVG